MTSKLAPAACLVALLALSASSASASGHPETRVVGGEQTTVEDWPWQVAIAHPPSEGGDGYDRQFCGGSLVAPTLVLTAAHCAYGEDSFEPPSKFSVISGRTTLSSNQGSEAPAADLFYFVDRGAGPVAQSSTQPLNGTQLYDPGTSEWDVVLIQLASPAPAPASPVQIAGPTERGLWEPRDPAFVTGWGDTTGAMTYSDDLQEAEVEIIEDADCANSYATPLAKFEPKTMVCAGNYPLGGEDSCQGDSGGPLVVPAGGGTFRLVGVTSWGIGCALPGQPGVYGRVADDPMRSALEAAVAQIAGGYDVTGPPSASSGGGDPAPPGGTDGPGAGAADDKAPRTTFESGPRKRTRKRTAVFSFSADEAGARFECALDRGEFKSCSSPLSLRVKRGRHTLIVRAIDAAGNVEPSPPAYRWKVQRKRR